VEAAAQDDVVRDRSPWLSVHLECHPAGAGPAKSGQRRHVNQPKSSALISRNHRLRRDFG
jgi:hypothetical protein